LKFAFITTTINKPIFLEDYLRNFNSQKKFYVEFFVIELDENKEKLISYKIDDQDTKYLNFGNDLIWVDVNSYLKIIKFFNFDSCMLENLTIYGRK